MGFTQEEIKKIEVIVDGIEKVREVINQQLDKFVYDASTKKFRLRKGKIVNNICGDIYKASAKYLTVSSPPSNLITDIFTTLYWDKPEIAKDLKETYNRHIYDVPQLFKIKDTDNLYDGLFSLQYNLSDLAKTLQTGANIAREELKPTGEGQESTNAKLDDIDEKIIAIYQEAEKQAANNPNGKIKLPGSRKIAKALYKTEITKREYSHTAINNRIKKLRGMGLVGHPDDNKDKANRCTPKHIGDISSQIKQKF